MNSHADYKNAVIGLNDEGDYSSVIDIEPVNYNLHLLKFLVNFETCLSGFKLYIFRTLDYQSERT